MASAPIVTKESSVLTLSNLTMTTSMTSFQGLKPPPPLATAKFAVDTTNNNTSNSNHNHSDKHQQLQQQHHQQGGGSTSSSNNSDSPEHHHNGHNNINHFHQHHSTTSLHKNSSHGMPSPRKSVEFILHPPPSKRTKLDTAWTAKQVVDAVSTSIAPHERLEAIQKTKEAFDHENQRGHDDEIASGADSVLVKHLAFVLTSTKNSISSSNTDTQNEMSMTELSLTLECLELLYRASSVIVGASFRRMGSTLLQLLKTIVTDEINRRTKHLHSEQDQQLNNSNHNSDNNDKDNNQHNMHLKKDPDESHTDEEQQEYHDGARSLSPSSSSLQQQQQQNGQEFQVGTPEGDILLKKATRIFGHFARVGEATKPMAHFPGFIDGLVRIVTLKPYDNLPWEARLSALWCIANLACNGDNMEMMASAPGLIAALIDVSHRPLHPNASLEHTMEVLRARSIASRAILNLSWSTTNKAQMASNTNLLDLLAELVLRRNAPYSKSRTVRDIVTTTRRHAIGAIRNLAAASRTTKVALCNYKDGHMLDVLTEAALNDPDQSTVDRAFAAIHNLANHDTAVKIVSHPALVMALKDVLMSSDAADHEDGTPKSHASATLLVLERSIRPDMPEYENLKGLLEAMNPGPNSSDGCGGGSDSMDGMDMERVEATAV